MNGQLNVKTAFALAVEVGLRFSLLSNFHFELEVLSSFSSDTNNKFLKLFEGMSIECIWSGSFLKTTHKAKSKAKLSWATNKVPNGLIEEKQNESKELSIGQLTKYQMD